METALLGSVIGTGYLLSKQGKNNRKQLENDISSGHSTFITPSQNNIYDSNYYNQTKYIEAQLVNDNYTKAKNGIETNVIAPNFNNNIINNYSNPIGYLQKPKVDYEKNISTGNIVVSPLTGVAINKNEYTHSNMVPFFGSHIRQVTDSKANSMILEHHTGMGNYNVKKEARPLFEPSKDTATKYGNSAVNEDIRGRINPSIYRQNELPFEQIKVGPGINQGFSAKPSGGYNQDVREYVLPKTIDDLRPLTRQQVSYKGRVVAGKAINTKGEMIGKVEKYRPETFYENSEDRYITTTGAYTKETSRPELIVKETNRKDSSNYTGGAAPAVKKKTTSRSLYKQSIKTSYKTDGPRNAHAKQAWTDENFGDYGKNAITPVSNERETTGNKTHVSNITTLVKALVAPLMDVMKTSRKENAEGNIRQTGNMGTGQLTKPTVWDPNDIAKTTIKETLIHDTHTGNITTTQGLKGTVLDKEEMKFKTTIRETLTPEETVLNMRANERNVVKDMIDDVAKKTIRETTEDDNHLGILAGPVKLAVYDPNDVARTTIKETLIHDVRTGSVGGLQKGMGYITNENEAPNTNRQFTQDYEYEGIVDAERYGGGTGYMTADVEAPNTNRQFTSDYEYEGNADSMYKKPTSYDAGYNMRQNIVKEGTLEGRNPTKQSVKLYNGKDTLTLDVKKMDSDRNNSRQPVSTKVYNSVAELKKASVTTDRYEYNNKLVQDRIDPTILDAFNSNPYTQSLQSYLY